jgi:hypothetical protein
MAKKLTVLMASIMTLGAAASFNGCSCHAETGGGYYAPPPQETVYESEPPPAPPPQQEAMPPSPGVEYVWVGGYHRWDGHAYIWVHGRYERRPHPAAHWNPAHWEVRGRSHVWIEGRWN